MKAFQNIPKHKQSIMLNYLFVLPIPSIIARLSNLVKGGCIKNTEFNEEHQPSFTTKQQKLQIKKSGISPQQ